MANQKTWLVVADSSKARIFSMYKARIFQKENPNDLELIGEYTHNESRQKDSDLVSDKLGEFGSGTFVEGIPPKVYEADVFARELLHQIETGRKEQHFRDLVLVAPPTFMRFLKKHMHDGIQKLVIHAIEKDYTQQNQRELLERLVDQI